MRCMSLRTIALLAALLAIPLGVTANDNEDAEPYLTNVRRLTHTFERAGEAYFRPDGKRILFQGIKAGQPYYQIYIMNADGSGLRMVSTGKGKTTCMKSAVPAIWKGISART